jgi:tRNA (Thr-GGU) A37 N-methylase
MTQIVLTPIGRVRSNVTDPKEDYWGNIVSVIEFEKGQLESGALKGLEDFSHVEVLFHLSDVPESSIERGGRHPRSR